MALPHKSVATIDNIEFVNLSPLDISPLMSKCEIKVFYLGKNRNGSFINKETALEMARTLRGAPIVGYYKDSKQDFADHGQKVTIDDQGVHFECLTKPYGFVAPNAKVWFKTFEEQDDFDNPVEREYLMTEGYLWTGQFEEAKQVFEGDGKPQSMELDEDSVNGHWTEDNKTGMEFFIINDAIVSKLCILGDDVQPCFEGASVTAPEVSKDFTLDKNFKKTLFDMMKQLEFALQGGNTTVNNVENNTAEQAAETTPSEQTTEFSAQPQDKPVEVAAAENQDNTEANVPSETFKKNDNEEDNESNNSESSKSESPEETSDNGENEEEDDEKKKSVTKNSLHTDEEYDALEQKLTELQTQFNELSQANAALIEFKNQVEDKQKDELIAKFYMLSDDDKKDVIENKRKYSLEEIEAKLAVIGYHKGVNFDLSDTSKNEYKETEDVFTVNMNDENASALPDWVKAVREAESGM